MPALNIKGLQMLLKGSSLYAGEIDGVPGPATRAGATAVLNAIGKATTAKAWGDDRQRVGAAQSLLNDRGYGAGTVDGLMGHNTTNAMEAYLADKAGMPIVIERVPLPIQPTAANLPTQASCPGYYGDPSTGGVTKFLRMFTLPFPLILDWDLTTVVTRVQLHEKCGDAFVLAMNNVIDEYGSIARLDELGLRRFAGGYNHRRMRGGSKWSMHAYGCAVDFYAAPNGLTTRCPHALFCQSAYNPFLDAMESAGWLPAIRLWGADAMHFQMARL